jgi:hypothetical protein
VQHERAARLGRREGQLLADAPALDRFVQVEQERLENEPDHAVRRDEEEVDARHPHQQEIDMGRPRQAPVIGQLRTARQRALSERYSTRNLR